MRHAAGKNGFQVGILQVSQESDNRIKPHSYVKKPNGDHVFLFIIWVAKERVLSLLFFFSYGDLS